MGSVPSLANCYLSLPPLIDGPSPTLDRRNFIIARSLDVCDPAQREWKFSKIFWPGCWSRIMSSINNVAYTLRIIIISRIQMFRYRSLSEGIIIYKEWRLIIFVARLIITAIVLSN